MHLLPPPTWLSSFYFVHFCFVVCIFREMACMLEGWVCSPLHPCTDNKLFLTGGRGPDPIDWNRSSSFTHLWWFHPLCPCTRLCKQNIYKDKKNLSHLLPIPSTLVQDGPVKMEPVLSAQWHRGGGRSCVSSSSFTEIQISPLEVQDKDMMSWACLGSDNIDFKLSSM